MQQSIFKTKLKYLTYEQIISEFSVENKKKDLAGKNIFGYWMQTLADLQFLDLELSGLIKNYKGFKVEKYDVKKEFKANLEFRKIFFEFIEEEKKIGKVVNFLQSVDIEKNLFQWGGKKLII